MFAILELRFRMGFLYVVFIVSIAALLCAAYAMIRTVRREGRRSPDSVLDRPDRSEDETAETGGPTAGSGRPGEQ